MTGFSRVPCQPSMADPHLRPKGLLRDRRAGAQSHVRGYRSSCGPHLASSGAAASCASLPTRGGMRAISAAVAVLASRGAGPRETSLFWFNKNCAEGTAVGVLDQDGTGRKTTCTARRGEGSRQGPSSNSTIAMLIPSPSSGTRRGPRCEHGGTSTRGPARCPQAGLPRTRGTPPRRGGEPPGTTSSTARAWQGRRGPWLPQEPREAQRVGRRARAGTAKAPRSEAQEGGDFPRGEGAGRRRARGEGRVRRGDSRATRRVENGTLPLAQGDDG